MIQLETDSIALITGGGTGIGRAIAHALSDAGAAVAICGRRQEALDAVVRELKEQGRRAVAVRGDVSQRDDARRIVQETVDTFGALHILVNNAGIARSGPIDDMRSEQIERVIDIDLLGPIWMIRSALPHLREHRDSERAVILNISSSVTFNALTNYAVYTAAKAGLEALTRCLAHDFANDRIRVNAISPGVVETQIFRTLLPEDAPDEAVDRLLEQFARQTPLGRVGRPQDIAKLALFLVSGASSWMTGSIVPLDGGISLAG